MFGEQFELNTHTIEIVKEIGQYMPGGFFIYRADENEALLYANAAVFKIFGCASAEEFRTLTGFALKGMIHPDDYAAVTAAIAAQNGNDCDKLERVEFRIIRKDGAVRWAGTYGHYSATSSSGGIFYVFISDITEKHDEEERSIAIRNAVIDTLTNIYNTVWLINDIETESCSLYHGDISRGSIHADAIQNALMHAKYTETQVEYIRTLIAPEDQARMMHELSLPHIISELEQKDQFSATFLRQFENSKRYYRIDFGKVRMPGGRKGVMLGFKDVDTEIREGQKVREALLNAQKGEEENKKLAEESSLEKQQEQERRLALQEELLAEQRMREQQDKMITALASDYRSVYHIDLDSDDGVCYRADPDDPEQTKEGVHFPFAERFRWYAEHSVDPDYREDFLQFIQPENIRNGLAKSPIIAYRYLVHRCGKNYYEMIRMAGVRHAADRDDRIVHAVGLGLTDIDEEYREAMVRNQALRAALNAAEEANKAKTAFLSKMSHEIRTPMNAIIGLDSLALRKGNPPPETRAYLEQIGASARHLLELINDILDMSRIESGRMVLRKEEFSFRAMLDQINVMVRTQCADKGLKFDCKVIGGVSDYYIGDDMKLKQVLINILSNAVKFTEAPGTVSLTVERTAAFADQSTLRFSVKDTGIGMDEAFIPTIFEAFTQEDSSRSSKYGSTGLGMAIAKSILDLMNGTISVVSEKGAGTEFTVVLTLKNSRHSYTEGITVDPKDMHVLVVDDDAVAAEHAILVLGEAGIRADICLNGEEALEMISQHRNRQDPYNLILLDWKMPEQDGITLAKKIRSRYSENAVIIILTSFNWDDIMDHALQTGVDSFIAKPLFASNVISEFERIARKNKMQFMPEKPRADLNGRHILLAEDVMINAEIIKELLRLKGAETDHAENGRIAVETFASVPEGYYDAVLMDVRMPEMDGLEATAAIRKLNRADAKTVPVIAMTANAFDEDVQRSLQAGMNAHLSKPVEAERLYQTLEELIWDAEQSS